MRETYFWGVITNEKILISLICLFGVLPLSSNPLYPLFPPKKQEVRAVWLTTIKGLDWPKTRATTPAGRERQKQELVEILDELQAANVNTVLLQTRVRGNLIYPSAYETWSEALTGKAGRDPGYDPLAFAIEECHKRGMELHAWMVTFPLGSQEVQKELKSQSVVKRHPHIVKRFRDNWYLNPGHPETKYYLVSLIRELLVNYDVDGVHFDYIRYPDRPQRFPDASDYRKYGGDLSLSDWRRQNITDIVRHLYKEVKQLKPWVKVSSAPLGKYRDTKRYPSRGWNAYHAVFQETQRWLKEGIQDLVFPMLYYRGNDFYPFVLDWQEQANGRMVVPGLGIYFLDPKEGVWTLADVEQQLNFIRWSGADGEAHFRSQFFTDRKLKLYDRMKNGYYQTKALLPPMTWIDSIAPGRPSAGDIIPMGNRIRLEWKAAEEMREEGLLYNLYASATPPVDVENPTNLKAVRLRDTSYVSLKDNCYYAVTAMDRYGNESLPLQLGWGGEESADVAETGRLLIEDGVLTLDDLPEAHRITIVDVAGRNVTTLLYNRRLRVANLPAGCYRICVWNESGLCLYTGVFVR